MITPEQRDYLTELAFAMARAKVALEVAIHSARATTNDVRELAVTEGAAVTVFISALGEVTDYSTVGEAAS